MSKVSEIVTRSIIQKLEDGVIPWKKTWVGGSLPSNFISKRTYSGINLLLLMHNGYKHPYYLTAKQIKSKGGYIKKGEKGKFV